MRGPATDPLLGTSVLGRYRIVRKLARGGMGAVYLGRTEGAEGFARPVVVKRVLPALMDDREVAQMFVREARILSNLQHQGIVGVLDFGLQEDGAYVMVLEYVHGYQLAQWHQCVLRTRGPMPVDFALLIAIRVLEALHYAHTFKRGDGTELSIVHRDISPSNILLSEQGAVKLLDFGIARVSGDSTEFHTERPRIKGKLPYLPIEVFQGQEPSARGDLYSLAVVLYELLTGTNPFAGRSTADIFHKVLTVTVPSVHATRDDAPERIDEVLQRALSRNPADRYASAADFAAALRALRSEPEDETAARLREQVREDFAATLPKLFELEPLPMRELAWRDPDAAPDFDLDFAMDGLFATDKGGDPPTKAHDAVTVQRSLQPGMLNAAVATDPPRGEAIGAAPPDSPTAARAEAAGAAPASRRAWTRWLAGALVLVAAMFGGAQLSEQLMGEDRIVVISRESTGAPQPPAPAPAPAPAPPPEPARPEPAPAQPVAAPEPAPEPAKAPPRAATVANPRQLTRAFSRRQTRIQGCFATHAATLEGAPQLSVHFVVSAQGKVVEATLEPDALAGTPLGRCLLDAARGTYFGPQPEQVSFHIPITAQRLE